MLYPSFRAALRANNNSNKCIWAAHQIPYPPMTLITTPTGNSIVGTRLMKTSKARFMTKNGFL